MEELSRATKTQSIQAEAECLRIKEAREYCVRILSVLEKARRKYQYSYRGAKDNYEDVLKQIEDDFVAFYDKNEYYDKDYDFGNKKAGTLRND